jgi:phage recombination protein Bet
MDDKSRALLGRTVCKGATDDELDLFVAAIERTGLDPHARQLYWIKRGGRATIQISIDGQRSIAESTGELDGQQTDWCGQDGVWVDVWLSDKPPAAARAQVYRKGCSHAFTGVAKWAEYAGSGPIWEKMSALMLAKCASSQALRSAFPLRLSGLYTDVEMQQSDTPATVPSDAGDDAYETWVEGLVEVGREGGYTALLAAVKASPEDLQSQLRQDRTSWETLKSLSEPDRGAKG